MGGVSAHLYIVRQIGQLIHNDVQAPTAAISLA